MIKNNLNLVNCPTHVYIKGEDLFRNLFLLLTDNGIIITRISINAYKKLTDKKEIVYINS